MSIQETQKFCERCRQTVLARRQGTNHVLHFLITALTCGLWAFVWAGQAVRFGGWRCPWCGGGV